MNIFITFFLSICSFSFLVKNIKHIGMGSDCGLTLQLSLQDALVSLWSLHNVQEVMGMTMGLY